MKYLKRFPYETLQAIAASTGASSSTSAYNSSAVFGLFRIPGAVAISLRRTSVAGFILNFITLSVLGAAVLVGSVRAQDVDSLRAPILMPQLLVYPLVGAGPLPFGLVERDSTLEVIDEEEVVVNTVWESDVAAKFNISQASFRNWTEGGVNTLSSSSQFLSKIVRTTQNWSETFEARLGFGVVKQDTLNLRKADDIIRLLATVKYHGQGFFRKFNPTTSAGLRTQFAPGFNYERNPFEDDQSLPVKVSDLFSPATFTQSLGLTYSASWGFRQRLGVAAKETVVLIERFRQLYGVTPDQPVRFQLGAESLTEIDREIFRNVELKSSLGLFAAFNQEDLPDMLWENVVVMKVNKWLSADFELVTLFDRDLSDRVQLKESLSIGFSFVFI